MAGCLLIAALAGQSGNGHICGLSVAYRADGEIRAHYFPLRHPHSQNLDRERILQPAARPRHFPGALCHAERPL